jgi:hypothetical protein
MMIPKEAKICPHCRKSQGTSFAVGCLAVISIFFFIGLLSVVFSPNNSKERIETAVQKANVVPLTKQATQIKKNHPSWSNEMCNTIGDKKISIGMTADQVILAWGKPYKINSSKGAGWEREQWVVHDSIDSDYLYFQNGILTSMQRSNK